MFRQHEKENKGETEQWLSHNILAPWRLRFRFLALMWAKFYDIFRKHAVLLLQYTTRRIFNFMAPELFFF